MGNTVLSSAFELWLLDELQLSNSFKFEHKIWLKDLREQFFQAA